MRRTEYLILNYKKTKDILEKNPLKYTQKELINITGMAKSTLASFIKKSGLENLVVNEKIIIREKLEKARKMIEDNPLVYTRRNIYEALNLNPENLNRFIRNNNLDRLVSKSIQYNSSNLYSESYKPLTKEKLIRYYKAYNPNFKPN